MRQAIAFAPASIGNVAVGFDVLGMAIAGVGDRCTATAVDRRGVRIRSIGGLSSALPADPLANTAGRAALSLLDSVAVDFGVELEIEKGIPLGSGMGGSAASAVAGVVAVNALLPEPLATTQLLQHAMAGEALTSGSVPHADNIAPALFGGLTLVMGQGEPVVSALPLPRDLVSVLIHPHLRLDTSAGRGILSQTLEMSAVVEQLAAMAGFISACYSNDHDLLRLSLKDLLIEPQRVQLIPGFRDVQRSALECGAMGCSISGSGPSVFAWCEKAQAASLVAAMQSAFAGHGLASDYWVSPLDAAGATVEIVA